MPLATRRKRVIIVTGASRGLGREIAIRFGRAGEKVVVNYIMCRSEAEAVADEIGRSGGEAIPFQADVKVAAQVEAMIESTKKRFGALDVLVNNAGITKDGLLVRMTEHDWDDVIETNLKGPFLCIRAASEIMSKQQSGHVINVSSISGVQGREGQANYSASKAGLIGLTRACARELGRSNIKVNAVLPGYITTDMGEKVSDGIYQRVLRENALNRVSDPEEVSDFIYYLSLMNNVSGQVFNLDSRII
jgi:3-oxoacyl-[acyl-carrier protein] reductase